MEDNPDLINLIDDFLLSNKSKVIDDAKYFYNIKDYSKKYSVKIEDIISVWLDNKLDLYTNLRAEYCLINRYANKKERRYDTFDIGNGRDFYQHENSPQVAIRKFIPCRNSEIKEHLDFEGSSLFKYTYNGYASGYWKMRPESIAHFAKENYNLKNANDEWILIPGKAEVKVFGRDNSDYLIFNKDVYIPFEQLYVTSSGCEVLNKIFTRNEKNETEKYYPPHNRIAVFLLINAIFSEDRVITYSNVSTFLDGHKINIKQTTVKELLEGTFEERHKPYRTQPQHSKIASCLISYYCKNKNLSEKPAIIARELNDLVKSSSRKWNVNFTAEIVRNIMNSK